MVTHFFSSFFSSSIMSYSWLNFVLFVQGFVFVLIFAAMF